MRRPLVAAVFVAPWLVGGCGAAVEVAPTSLDASPACRTVAAAWPKTVADAPRTATRPEAVSTAAWAARGGPAVVARCGVGVPGPTTNECIAVDDVDWVAERLDDGMRFTTYGRTPALEVLVPDAYAPEPLVLSGFGNAARTTQRQGPGCS